MQRPTKQSMNELKLRRLLEHNQRLRDDYTRPRTNVSEASNSLIRHCKTTRDPMVPSVWGQVSKTEDPYASQANTGGGCCIIA